MNPNTENFDQLRKLLALKRYELPPPRYFNEFSGRIMARLAEPEHQPPAIALRIWITKVGPRCPQRAATNARLISWALFLEDHRQIIFADCQFIPFHPGRKLCLPFPV